MKYLTSFFVFLFSLPAFASRECTQGPGCDALRSRIAEIKNLKKKRHEDVQQFGKKSEEVKADDRELQKAAQEDHQIRSERKVQMRSARGKRRHFSPKTA